VSGGGVNRPMENGDTYTPAEAERLLGRTDKPISERRIRGIDHAHSREAAVPAERLVVQPHPAPRPRRRVRVLQQRAIASFRLGVYRRR
jgi:hypothetical protein